MALALDGSTPVTVTFSGSSQTSVTNTTASFTPPANSVLVCVLCTEEGFTHQIGSFSVTDNLAGHLTYTQIAVREGPTSNGTQVNAWWAPVATSAPMTVSASYVYNISDSAFTMFQVLVFTGADTTGAIGASGGGLGRITNLSGSAAQYTSTRDDSWGWLAYADWNNKGVPTVPAAETVYTSFGGTTTNALIKNNATTTPVATTVTLTTSTPTTGMSLSWLYFEVLPALAGKVFRPSLLNGLGAGGPFFQNPLG